MADLFRLPAAFPISFGIERAILSRLNELHPPTTEEKISFTEREFQQVVQDAYCKVYPPADVKAHLSTLLDAVAEYLLQLQTQSKQPIRPRRGKEFGSRFSEWLSELSPSDLCLYLANYDPERARDLFWKTDKQDVIDAVDQRIGHEMQEAILRFEACLFASGGSYEGGGGPNSKMIDLSAGEGMEELARFGLLPTRGNA